MQSFNLRSKERRTGSSSARGGSVIRAPRSKKRLISIKLAIVARRLRMRFDQRAEQSGITRAQWSVLAAVGSRPGATQRTLANLLSVTDVTAGRMIDRLCAEGYVERRQDPEDRRAYRVYLTEAARPVLSKLGKVSVQFEEELFTGIDDEDLRRLDELLTLMARNLGESLGRPENKTG